jgi:hypothetical protein
MDTVCFRTLGGGAARYAQLGARPAERHFHHDLAGSNGAGGSDLGFCCLKSGSKLYLAWGGGSVPGEPASGGPAFRSAITQRAIIIASYTAGIRIYEAFRFISQ